MELHCAVWRAHPPVTTDPPTLLRVLSATMRCSARRTADRTRGWPCSVLYAPTPRLSLRLSVSALKASVTPRMASGGACCREETDEVCCGAGLSCGSCALLVSVGCWTGDAATSAVTLAPENKTVLALPVMPMRAAEEWPYTNSHLLHTSPERSALLR